MRQHSLPTAPPSAAPRWPALLVWAVGAAAMLGLDGRLDLANLALLLMLTSAVASLWLSGWATAAASAAAVAAFDWSFMPPRGAWHVDLRQHGVLLGTMLAVNWIVSGLMVAQRHNAEQARVLAEREARLRRFGDALRDAEDPLQHAATLRQQLAEAAGLELAGVALSIATAADPQALLTLGAPDGEQQAGLAVCLRQNQAMGPGAGRHEEQPDVYLPLRGRGAAFGSAVLHGLAASQRPAAMAADLLPHLQALCDQLGQALQRAASQQQQRLAREQAKDQATRSALLAAVAHDTRTPLATIIGAASSLAEQGERLGPEQRQQMALAIVQEARRLNRLADNTLQLARLGAPGVALRCDWEAAEEIVGAVLQRVRGHDALRRVRARLEPALPLLWCDALLIAQLLDNLVDNALKYSPDGTPVELLVRHVSTSANTSASSAGPRLVLAVRDRGPGVPRAWRDKVFGLFERGDPAAGAGPTVQGSGVGLAVCRAIAQAHGGTLLLRQRGRGGSSFECSLPVKPAPLAGIEAR